MNEKDSKVFFQVRGRHPNLYPVDLPDLLDEGIKDELLSKFSITLLQDLVSLVDQDRNAKSKHVHSVSNVSQTESIALSLDSSSNGSLDVHIIQAFRRSNIGTPKHTTDVEKWRNSSSASVLEEP